MSLSGAGQFVTHLDSYSCAQLGNGTLMCPVGQWYTHVPSWAMVHTCAQLGNGTLMCPVGQWYTHVPLGDGTLMCSVG